MDIIIAELAATDVTDVIIEGGNHAQYGDFGTQMVDGEAKISKQKQIDITIEEMAKFLKKYL